MWGLFIAGLLAVGAQAADCPEKWLEPKGKTFSAFIGGAGKDGSVAKCEVPAKSLPRGRLEVKKCFTTATATDYMPMQAPEKWKRPSCFPKKTSTFYVLAQEFRDPDLLKQAGSEAECPRPGEQHVNLPSGLLTVFLNNDDAKSNDLKTVEEIDKYHLCLFEYETRRVHKDLRSVLARSRSEYLNNYRYMIQAAAKAFNVPIGFLTCVCGQESLFNDKSVSNKGVHGLCQNTQQNLKDIQKKRDNKRLYPELGPAFDQYFSSLDQRLESRKCTSIRLDAPGATRMCPSLNFAAAATYLYYGYSRVADHSKKLGKFNWNDHSLPVLTAIAAAYNVSVDFSGGELNGVSDPNLFGEVLLEATCKDFGKYGDAEEKFMEMKAEMISVRNCLAANSWLNHQGDPLLGDCQNGTEQAQLDEFNSYVKGMPATCADALNAAARRNIK